MVRNWLRLLLIVVLAVFAREPAHAQQNPAAAPPAPPPAALTPEQARAALDTLNDPKKRAAFAATLEALTKSQAAPAPPAAGAPAPPSTAAPAAPAGATPETKTETGIEIQLAPDSLGAQVLLSASTFLSELASDSREFLRTVQSGPLLWGWLVVMVTNPMGQHLLMDAARMLLLSLACAGAMGAALRYLLRRPMARVLNLGVPRANSATEDDEDHEARAELGAIEAPERRGGLEGFGRRLLLGLTRFALQMVPVLGFLLAGHAAAVSDLRGLASSRLVVLAVLDAIAGSLTLIAVLTLLFMPEPPGLKLLPMRPSAGAYLMRWGKRLILIAVPGYTIGEVGLLLGLSPSAHGAWQKIVGLALIVCLGIIVVQRRRPVRRWLSAPPEAKGFMALIRNRLARYWYGIALFFLTASWLTWALQAPDAMGQAIWYFAVTVAVLVAATMARGLAAAMLAPIAPRPPAETNGAAATTAAHAVQVRLSAYHATLWRLARLIIGLASLTVLLQLYGLGSLTWLTGSEVGRRIVSGFGTLAVTIGVAFAVWEGVNIMIQMHLETLGRGSHAAKSARLRTLLPLIRTSLAITVLVVAGLMVLSEVGVNIAPLLAGAGIVGVAIGFGSQKLVQDVITGVFLLLENTMQVGDVVKVGDQSGVVESLSVRTIRLRTEDGSVVVIPFSAVTTVINMTRDYSRAVISVNVSNDQDVDGVVAAMRDIVQEMREEDTWGALILDEMEVWGLDRFTDTALQIKCRIMCTPFGRWSVGREFNRRLKMRFQIVGVSIPFSVLSLTVPEPPPAPQIEAPVKPEKMSSQSMALPTVQ